MVELQVLSKILKERNMSFLTLNNITDDYFVTYSSEYEFIRDHVQKYGNVPDKETFMSKFPDFTIVEVAETDKYLVDTFSNQAEALAKLQDPSGLWHTVLDDETSYVEASGSGAITAGIAKGVKLGILPEKYRATAENGIKGLIGSISEDGTVLNVSAGTPVGMNKDHYRSIIVRPMAYGQSLTLLALVEALDL